MFFICIRAWQIVMCDIAHAWTIVIMTRIIRYFSSISSSSGFRYKQLLQYLQSFDSNEGVTPRKSPQSAHHKK